MPIYDLFSKRQKALSNPQTDTLSYDVIPHALRVQLVHVIRDAFGISTPYDTSTNLVEGLYMEIISVLCREYGKFQLNNYRDVQSSLLNYVLEEEITERVLDAVELSCKIIDKHIRIDNSYNRNVEIKLKASDAIEEVNERFKQHAIGYQYEGGEMIKMDSTYVHSEIVKPTLQLLYNPTFLGANEEYLKAHEHYRHGRNKECLTECLKAFESVMKTICTVKAWPFGARDTSSALIQVCLNNNLVPAYMQSQLGSFRSLLESGIPTIRNRLGGHGQGADLTIADDETTRYALNLTGSNLIYLIELSKA